MRHDACKFIGGGGFVVYFLFLGLFLCFSYVAWDMSF